MYLTLGDYPVRKFRISSGMPSRPTPVGEFSIFIKQNVRIGAKPPHFIMPKFQMFKAGGFGFHALPSLANDKGIFWTEAKRDSYSGLSAFGMRASVRITPHVNGKQYSHRQSRLPNIVFYIFIIHIFTL